MTIEQEEISEKQVERIDHYNPVTVTLTEVTGVMAVSIIALILLFALLRSQRRIRELQEQQVNNEAVPELAVNAAGC